jgi:hypothetical protein
MFHRKNRIVLQKAQANPQIQSWPDALVLKIVLQVGLIALIGL